MTTKETVDEITEKKHTQHVQAVGWWKTTLEARLRHETSTVNEHIGRKDTPKCI